MNVVQIVIALVSLSISILMMIVTVPYNRFRHISVYTAYPIWGSVMFILSGSFSVAAAVRTTKCLVVTSLTLNVISSLFASAGIIIGILSSLSSAFNIRSCKYTGTDENCSMTGTILMGLDIMVVVLSVLQFCITISVSAFGCKVTCCSNDGYSFCCHDNRRKNGADHPGSQPQWTATYICALTSVEKDDREILEGEPKVLGVVQIVIALLNLSISILMMSVTLPFQRFNSISVYIGYPIWGAVMFISSGSFSIAAAIRTTKGLVRSSLGLNITSSLFAFAGMVIGAVSTVSYSSEIYFCKYRQTDENCAMNVSILLGLNVVVVVLSALQFCITISVSAFGCKVICCNNDGVVIIMPSSPPMAAAAPPSSFQGLMPPAQQETSLPENLQ